MIKFILSCAIGLGGQLGILAYYLPLKERAIAQRQLARFLPNARTETIKRMYDHLGRSFAEAVLSQPLLKHASVVCDDWHIVERLRAAGSGIVALTGHLGNWDLFAAYTRTKGVPLHAIGRETKSPFLQQLVKRLRDNSGVTMLWRTGVAGGREIARILSKGGVIAALIDQDTTVRSAWVPFFGHPAKTPTTLAEIALRNDAALVSSFLVRTGPLAYRVSIREITDRTSIQRVLEQYHAHLEELVRQYPEQWVWIHKRWRSPNESKAMSSREYLAWLSERGDCERGDSERASPAD